MIKEGYPKTGIIYKPASFWFLKLKILSEFLYFFILIHYKHSAVCNPIPRVTDSKWCSALQGIEYSWPHGSWCFPLVCIWPGPRQHKWRQMKLQRRGREITGSHWPGLGILGCDWSVGSPSTLIWHCMIPLMLLSIIDAELCSVHHLDTHPLTLWLAHCEDPGIPGTG